MAVNGTINTRTENQSGSDSWYINSSVDSHVFLSGSVYYILTWMHKMTRMEYQHGSDSSYINSSVDSQYQHGYNSIWFILTFLFSHKISLLPSLSVLILISFVA
jgi:hypothetical protein